MPPPSTKSSGRCPAAGVCFTAPMATTTLASSSLAHVSSSQILIWSPPHITSDSRTLLIDGWSDRAACIDWALHRSGAIFLQGTENARVKGGTFKRLDGNALMLNGFNRGAQIVGNEFVYIADNVIAGWGETKEWDGRNGDQPRGTVIAENFIHELGFFEKQSSAFFQAKSALTTLRDNIMFNMPRGAIARLKSPLKSIEADACCR
jgi:hypothetical protein